MKSSSKTSNVFIKSEILLIKPMHDSSTFSVPKGTIFLNFFKLTGSGDSNRLEMKNLLHMRRVLLKTCDLDEA